MAGRRESFRGGPAAPRLPPAPPVPRAGSVPVFCRDVDHSLSPVAGRKPGRASPPAVRRAGSVMPTDIL